MSVFNNKYVPFAATRLGFDAANVGRPIVDALLNDVQVESCGVVEVTEKGKAIAIIVSEGTIRAVADTGGNVRLYANADAAISMARKSNLPASSAVVYYRADKTATVGDPVSTLKTKHRAAKVEANSAKEASDALTKKVAAATSLGWGNAAAGSPEAIEFADLQARQQSVSEWALAAQARLDTLTQALIAAGIDPTTYMPIPAVA